MNPTIEKIQSLIEENNEKAAPLMKKLGLASSSFSDWKRDKASPSTEAIVKIAKYFNVSTDYLLLDSYVNNSESPAPVFISPNEQDWISLYRELIACDPKLLKECQSYIKGSIKGYQLGKESSSSK